MFQNDYLPYARRVPTKPSDLLQVLRRALRERRNDLGLTQEEVADVLGMAVRHYQKIEAGELNITLRTLARVASAVRTSPADLLK